MRHSLDPRGIGALLLWLLMSGCSPTTAPDDGVAKAPELDPPGPSSPLPDWQPEVAYQARCASCHDSGTHSRAQDVSLLARMSPARLVFAMTNGVMKEQAEGLAFDQVRSLAGYIGGNKPAFNVKPQTRCENTRIDPAPVVSRWGMDERHTFSLPDGASPMTSRNVGTLTLDWAFGLPDVVNARSQPVITRNTLFVAATSGHLFALDAASGCVRWHQALDAPPRTALTLGEVRGKPALLFGDQAAHLNAVNITDGGLIWRSHVGLSDFSLLTGSPVQHQGQILVPVSLYEAGLAADPNHPCCRAHGGVVSLEADTGRQQWVFHTTEEASRRGESPVGTPAWGPSGAPVWGAPTVDPERQRVYVGTGQNASPPATENSDAVLALDLNSGALMWRFQTLAGDVYNTACDQQPPGPNCPKWPGPDHDIGASIALVADSQGRERLIVGQKSGDIYALDPDRQGQVMWQRRVGAGSALGGIHWGLAIHNNVIFAPVADPPFPLPGYRPRPGLYALALDSGKPLWDSAVERDCVTNLYAYFGRQELYPACSFYFGLSAAPLAVNDLVFAPALDGRIRAFDQSSGRVLWQASTAGPAATVNGVAGHGGAIDVAGVQVSGDRLYVQSGYGMFGQLPGNVLLAFTLKSPGQG